MNSLNGPGAGNSHTRLRARSLIRSKWLFPLALLVPLLTFTALGISGSSIGMYNTFLRGPGYQDPDLLVGRPQPIRSDEWLVATPYAVSQASNGYPRTNPDIGYGQDMSVIVDAPYEDWSIIFKPHNLAFFVLPLENAFAFRWWILGYLLMVGCYFLVLQILPDKRNFAALLSLALFFSPFVQWWYLPSTLASLTFPILALIALIRLLRAGSKWRKVGWTVAFSYFLVGFLLILYPPFQIATAVAATLFAIGYLLEFVRERGFRATLGSLGHVLVGLVIAGVVAGAFILTRLDVIDAITETVYPGKRTSPGGEYSLALLFSTHLLPLVQSSTRGLHYVSNQSEVSNFIFITPFLLFPSVYLLFRDRSQRSPTDYLLLLINSGILLLGLRLIIPGFNWFYRLLLFDRVPTPRLLIGLGLLGFFQIVLLHRKDDSTSSQPVLAWGTTVAALGSFLLAGFIMSRRYPEFVSEPLFVVSLSLILTLIVFLYLRMRFVIATLALLAFSVGSVVGINPLYRGVDPLVKSELFRRMISIGDRDGSWIVVGDLIFEHYPTQLGLQSFSGTYAYPQLDVWKEIDPEGRLEEIYNRYAHVTFATDLNDLFLYSPDHFGVPFDSCSAFIRRHNIRHVLSPGLKLEDQRCLRLDETVSFPALDFYIYRVDGPGSADA